MSKHDKYKHWTTAGTLSTLSEFQIGELEKTHSVEIYHRRVMIRKKPNRQLTMTQQHKRLETMGDFAPKVKQDKHKTSWYRFHRWLRKVLLVIITFELVIGYATFNAKQLIGVEAKVDISPVTFTDKELQDFYAKYSNPAPVASKSVEDLIRKHFGDVADQAIDCFKSESGLRANAVNTKNRNGTVDRGVAQINSIHCGKVQGDCATALLDAETNIKIAKQLYDRSGFNPWYGVSCRKYWK